MRGAQQTVRVPRECLYSGCGWWLSVVIGLVATVWAVERSPW